MVKEKEVNMNGLMIVLIVFTTISSLGLTWSTLKDYEGWQLIFGLTLGIVIVFGWLLVGITMPISTSIERIPKNEIEVIVGKDKVIVTDMRSDKTSVLFDAKTYNSVSIDKDSTFNLEQDLNMYGIEINNARIVKNK